MAVNSVMSARGKLNGLYAHGRTPDRTTEIAARRALTLAKLERAVQEAIDAIPPLTAEQREQVARLLSGGAA